MTAPSIIPASRRKASVGAQPRTARPASARINARFSPQDEARVRELAATTKKSTSEVLREAVREYHARHVKPQKNAYEMMMETGFIGCGDGPPDLSSRYKHYLAESLMADYEATQKPAKRLARTGR